MLLNNAVDIRIGARKVLKVFVGGNQVWPLGGSGKYFRFAKKVVWLTPADGFTTHNAVESNTDWILD